MNRAVLILFLVFSIVAVQLIAGTTGKITGQVVDDDSGEPLPGVNVVIVGTMFGAATDLKGEYIILNVAPGIYEIRATMIGYTAQKATNVKVSIDLTTHQNFRLSTTVLDVGEEVTIVADRPLILKDVTSSRSLIGAQEIQQMPVENPYQVLELQAGVVQGSGGEMHVRGGRSGEILYLVDGISVTDPYSSNMAITVENQAIQELEMVSGTFNAEYGQAMSGIVNMVTKEGSRHYSGEIRSYIGDYFSSHDDVFFNIDEIDPLTIQDYQASLSGPVPFTDNRLTFFTSGRYYDTDSYYTGIRRYSPSDSNSYDGVDPAGWLIQETGDGKFVPMSQYARLNNQWKLAYSLSPSMKITYNIFAETSQSLSYSHKYIFNPDGRATSYHTAYNNILTWTHTLSARTFYSFKMSSFYNYGKSYAYEDPYDSRYVSDDRFDRASTYNYYMGGVSLGHFYRSTLSNSYLFELTGQVNKIHQIKAGMQYRWNKLFLDSYSLILDNTTNYKPEIPDVTQLPHDKYTNYPRDFSIYLQDKIELLDMIVNVGIRFEYFDPNHHYLTDSRDPNLWLPNKYTILDAAMGGDTVRVKLPIRINPDTKEVTIIDPNTGDPIGSQIDRLKVTDAVSGNPIYITNAVLVDTLYNQPITRGSINWFKNAKPKFQLSPRIGIAYPISATGVIHFSYGHFLQIPEYSYLFTNPEFEVVGGGSANTLMGNADLEPQRTVSYEIGLQQQLSDNIAFDVTGFYKDIRNLLGTEIIKTYNGDMYARYINRDYGNVRGITFSLKKRYSNYISASLDYTYSVSEGNASDPNQTYYDQQNGREPEKQMIPLNWDQSHTLNIWVTITDPKKWGISLIGQYGSGLPYTATSQNLQGFQQLGTTFMNSNRKPSRLNVDLKLNREIYYNNLQFSIFMYIYNLFDIKNEDNVYSDTGRSTYSLTPTYTTDRPGPNSISDYFIRPDYYSAPRSIRLGLAINF